MLENHLTVAEVARILGVCPNRVCVLIRTGRLPAIRIGRQLFIREADVELVKVRKPGKPRKAL